MKNLKGALMILGILTAPIFSVAQYVKLTKGQPCPFDTAVAVKIDRYRLESEAIKLGRDLDKKHREEVASLRREINTGDSLNIVLAIEATTLAKAYARKDSVATLYLDRFDRLLDIKTPKEWGWKEWGAVILAGLLGYGIGK